MHHVQGEGKVVNVLNEVPHHEGISFAGKVKLSLCFNEAPCHEDI